MNCYPGMGHKRPVLRRRCIGIERAPTPLLFYSNAPHYVRDHCNTLFNAIDGISVYVN